MPGVQVNTTTPHLYGGLDLISIVRNLFEALPFGSWDSFTAKVETWWNIYAVIAILLSLLFFIGFIYAKIRLGQLYELIDKNNADAEAMWNAINQSNDSRNTRWDAIQQKVLDNNPESWRIAIIEADILLDEALKHAGYVGQSIGDKLKTANSQSFRTVQDAWEAHKVRNEIAHVGSDFILTQKSAQETITRFERVFREFDVI